MTGGLFALVAAAFVTYGSLGGFSAPSRPQGDGYDVMEEASAPPTPAEEEQL